MSPRAVPTGFFLLLMAGCAAPPPPAAPPRVELLASSRLPKRADLVCFPCHSHVKFEKGPPFPHAPAAHRMHCHTCHEGGGHHGQEIDRSACLSCHEEGSAELHILASR